MSKFCQPSNLKSVDNQIYHKFIFDQFQITNLTINSTCFNLGQILIQNTQKMRNSTISFSQIKSQKKPQLQKRLTSILNTLQPSCNSYQTLTKVEKLAKKLSSIETFKQNPYAMLRKFKKFEPEERLNDMTLSKALTIENQIMDQQTKKLSKYILKDTYDFGIKNYYNKVSQSVKTRLILQGIKPQDCELLVEEKKKSSYRKSEMLRYYNKANSSVPKLKPVKRQTLNRGCEQEKGELSLNVGYRKYNHRMKMKYFRKGGSENREKFGNINCYFNM